MLKIGVISIHPAPYRDPVFETVCERGKIHFETLMMAPVDTGHREWNLPFPAYPIVPLVNGNRSSKSNRLHPGIFSALKKGRYDVILVPGYKHQTSLAAIAYARMTGLPYMLEADSVCYDHVPVRRNPVTEMFIRRIIKNAACVRVPGEASRQYMHRYGIDDSRIFEGAYCMDVEAFENALARDREQRFTWREKHNIAPDTYVFLHVGNMLASRRQAIILDLMRTFPPDHAACFVLIGSGEERERLKSLASSLPDGRVKMIDSIPFAELPTAYLAADAYVHPGYEPYSTAMELAAIAGLPIVSTKSVGYVADLVRRGAAPLLSRLDDSTAIRENMLWLLKYPSLGHSLGQTIRLAAITRTPDWAAEQLEAAAMSARAQKKSSFR